MPRQTTSTKKTSLNAVEQYELNQWLEQNHINSTNLRRSFTDVLPLARLLARYYPDLIDLNYYPPRNSVQNKLTNWESFNKRVLARLGVHLTRDQMVRVARSVPGSVDLLLYSIMRVQMAAERKAREAHGSSDEDGDDGDVDNAVQSENKVNEPQAAVVVDAEKKLDSTNLNTNDDNDDDVAGSVLPPKPNMPKTLKLAQAALKRSERLQMGHTVGILQRARGGPQSNNNNNNNNDNRRLTLATATATATGSDAIGSESSAAGVNRQRGEQQVQKQKQRTVLYSHYMQAVNQLQQKNDKIARFDQLSAHLENMLQLKCERIDELQQQVANAVNHLKPSTTTTTTDTHNNSNNSKNSTNNSNNSNNSNNNNKRRLRFKKRIRSTTNNSIEQKLGTIPIPGIGIAGANFPVKLSQFN
ncbi:hypothetical protein ACLKA7_007005 [Drosophila subpalustris]